MDCIHPHDTIINWLATEVNNFQINIFAIGYSLINSGNIFVALFLLFDNTSVIMMMVGNPSYRIVRRVSYSIFLFGIVWQIISIAIKLKESFNDESNLKKNLEEMTPVQFLERLNEIDEERKLIAI